MSNKVSAANNEDCLMCRLISGFGVMGAGTYIYAHSRNRSKIAMGTMRILAVSTIGLGLARLLNMSFLKSNKKES